MKPTRGLLLSAAVVLSSAAQAAPVVTAAEVAAHLTSAGYTHVHEIERDSGMWEADVTRPDGRFSEVVVDPASGEIFDAHDGRAVMDSAAILEHARKHGLTDIRKLERDGAIWKLEARDAQKQPVEVRLSGIDGRVLQTERERWWD